MKVPTRRKIFEVVGESHISKSGIPRQTILIASEPGDPVALHREPDNRFDENAILVRVADHDIGYISRSDAKVLAPALDEGLEYKARIHQLIGGVQDAPSIGARISIAWLGQSLPPTIERNIKQEIAREKKASALNQSRNEHGQFVRSDASGCLGTIALTTFMVTLILSDF